MIRLIATIRSTSYLSMGFILLFSSLTWAETDNTWQQEIDNQVWRPFVKAYESFDGPAFNALYADEVLRVTPAGIDTNGAFKQDNLMRFSNNKHSGASTELDFWFEHRQTNATTSYEVGYFRIQSSNNNEQSTFYGQFHIVLKKENNQWKITQDWDNTIVRGQAVSEADFAKGQPLVFD